MLVLCGILLGGGLVAFVASPLVTHRKARLTDGPDLVAELRELYALKDVTYEAIRDIEFDFHAGKIAETDFRDLSGRFKREALSIVQRIDGLEARLPHPPGRSRGGR